MKYKAGDIDNGGPAFPVNGKILVSKRDGMTPAEMSRYDSGMTLRDYFAAQASDEDIREIIYIYEHKITRQEARFIHANEMIKVRQYERK